MKKSISVFLVCILWMGSVANAAMSVRGDCGTTPLVPIEDELTQKIKALTPEQSQAILPFLIGFLLFHPAGRVVTAEAVSQVTDQKSAVTDECSQWRFNPAYANLYLTLRALKEVKSGGFGSSTPAQEACDALKKGVDQFAKKINLPLNFGALSEDLVRCACKAVGLGY